MSGNNEVANKVAIGHAENGVAVESTDTRSWIERMPPRIRQGLLATTALGAFVTGSFVFANLRKNGVSDGSEVALAGNGDILPEPGAFFEAANTNVDKDFEEHVKSIQEKAPTLQNSEGSRHTRDLEECPIGQEMDTSLGALAALQDYLSKCADPVYGFSGDIATREAFREAAARYFYATTADVDFLNASMESIILTYSTVGINLATELAAYPSLLEGILEDLESRVAVLEAGGAGGYDHSVLEAQIAAINVDIADINLVNANQDAALAVIANDQAIQDGRLDAAELLVSANTVLSTANAVKVAALEVEAAAKALEIADHESRIAVLEAGGVGGYDHSVLEAQIATLEAEQAAIIADIASNKAAGEAADAALAVEIADLNVTVGDQQTQLDLLAAQQALVIAEAAANTLARAANEAKIVAIEDAAAALALEVGDNTVELANYAAQIAAINVDIADINLVNANQDAALAVIANDQAIQDGRLDAAELLVSANTVLSTANAVKVAALEVEVANKALEIADHESRIAVLESAGGDSYDHSALEADIEALKLQAHDEVEIPDGSGDKSNDYSWLNITSLVMAFGALAGAIYIDRGLKNGRYKSKESGADIDEASETNAQTLRTLKDETAALKEQVAALMREQMAAQTTVGNGNIQAANDALPALPAPDVLSGEPGAQGTGEANVVNEPLDNNVTFSTIVSPAIGASSGTTDTSSRTLLALKYTPTFRSHLRVVAKENVDILAQGQQSLPPARSDDLLPPVIMQSGFAAVLGNQPTKDVAAPSTLHVANLNTPGQSSGHGL